MESGKDVDKKWWTIVMEKVTKRPHESQVLKEGEVIARNDPESSLIYGWRMIIPQMAMYTTVDMHLLTQVDYVGTNFNVR